MNGVALVAQPALVQPTFLQDIAGQVADGRWDALINGTLFRSIRGVQSKLELVDTPNALASLSRSIRNEGTSNAALRAIAQAAANTDGQEAALTSELVCQTIAEVPGLLQAVIKRLETDVDAVRLVNNLAANCMRSAELFVNVPGSMDALKASAKKFKLHSFGVINHLSRCPAASRALIKHGFVEDVLHPALDVGEEVELSVEQEATIARGTLALANLTGTSSDCPPANRVALETIVKVLDHAVRGERLATITWLPPAVLYGLRNMTHNTANKLTLLECGLAPVLAQVLDQWVPATGMATLELSIESVSNLSTEVEAVQVLWDAGVVRVLQHLADKLEEHSPCSPTTPNTENSRRTDMLRLANEARRLVEVLLQRHVAVCMGQHRRLGGDSPMMMLDDAVVYKILQFAFGTTNGSNGPFHL